MAKLFTRIENEKGKVASLSGNEYLDIDIFIGNKRLVALTLKPVSDTNWGLYNEEDKLIKEALYNPF